MAGRGGPGWRRRHFLERLRRTNEGSQTDQAGRMHECGAKYPFPQAERESFQFGARDPKCRRRAHGWSEQAALHILGSYSRSGAVVSGSPDQLGTVRTL